MSLEMIVPIALAAALSPVSSFAERLRGPLPAWAMVLLGAYLLLLAYWPPLHYGRVFALILFAAAYRIAMRNARRPSGGGYGER
jgi:hypothetical protein